MSSCLRVFVSLCLCAFHMDFTSKVYSRAAMRITYSFDRRRPFASLCGADDSTIGEYCLLLRTRLKEAFPDHEFSVVDLDSPTGDVHFEDPTAIDAASLALEIRRVATRTADELFASWGRKLAAGED